MSDSHKSDEEGTDELIASLNARASGDEGAPDVDPDEAGEDIEAFLADLDGGGEAAPAADEKPAAEPDPFPDAFASLAEEHSGDVEAELEAKWAAQDAEMAKAEAERERALEMARKKAEQEAAEVAEAAAAEEAAEVAATAEAKRKEGELAKTEAPDPPEAKTKEKDKEKKKSRAKDDAPPVVEKVRSPGFKFTVGLLKWTFLLTPALLAWWLGGAYLSPYFSTGWIIAAIATGAILVVPMLPRFGLGKGTYGVWTFMVGVLTVAALVAPMPEHAGRVMQRYGHWPVSTVSQLAKWQPNNMGVRLTASAADFLGLQLEGVRTPVAEDKTVPLALGSDELTLEKLQEQADATAKDAPEAKPEDKAEEKPAEDASKEDKPAEDPGADSAPE